MRNTYPLVSFGLDDTRIKDKATATDSPGDTPAFAFCNVNDLITNKKTVTPYITFEPNFWSLSGEYHFMPTSPHIGFMGSILTDATGYTFGDAIVKISFSTSQSTDSITLIFDEVTDNWCSWLTLQFYNGASLIYTSGTLHPASIDYTFTHTVSGFNIIYVVMSQFNNAYRFPRLTGVDFNTVIHLDSTKIKSAKITEEFSPISETLTSNLLELHLLVNNSDYSITNPSSLLVNLAKRMPFMVYEVKDNETELMGQFYLDSWDNTSTEKEIIFTCMDAIGILSQLPFFGWGSSPQMLPDIFANMFAGTNISYSLSADIISNTQAYGTYPYGINGTLEPNIPMREVLQRIAHTCRLSITCSKSYKVLINSAPATRLPYYLGVGDEDYYISLSQEAIKEVKLSPVVDAVKLIETHYSETSGTPQTIYSANLAVGTYIINLSGAFDNVILSNGVGNPPVAYIYFTSPGNGWICDGNGAIFYAFITVTSPSLVVLWNANPMGVTPYTSDTRIAGTIIPLANVIEVDTSIYMVFGLPTASMTNQSQAQWIYDYYLGRYHQKSKIFGIDCHAGDLVRIASLNSKFILGYVEKSVIDLVGLRSEIDIQGILA